MNVKRLFLSTIFIVMIIAKVSSAIITIIPDSTASKVCYLGYFAHCSFTPYGTIISIAGAFLTYFTVQKLNCLKF